MSTIYTIPARDVVPGMMWPFATDKDGQDIWRQIEHVDRYPDGCRLAFGSSGTHLYDADGSCHRVQLPGPSPRELCCRCCAHGCDLEDDRASAPDLHAAGCPVAPVTGLHGGMRLWPAPWRGQVWSYVHEEFRCGGRAAWAMDLYAVSRKGVNALSCTSLRRIDEWVLQAFFYPPTPPEPSGDRAAWEEARARRGYR